ncbi:LPS-assembly lipoprotein LptE [Stutzerimonas stutzeri]
MNKGNLVVLGLTLLLSACGFQLRGTGDVEFGLKELDLQARNSYGDTVRELQTLLERNDVRVHPGAKYSLNLANEQTRQRTASYTSSARSAEYELTSTLDYQFRGPQDRLLLEDRVEVQKVYVHDSNNLIGSYHDGAPISVRHGNAPRTARRTRRDAAGHRGTLRRGSSGTGRDLGTWRAASARSQGDKSVIRSLATLAHEGRRPQFAKSQLIAALQILESGDIPVEQLRGSWAGAMGQTQFIPTTYNTHAVDFDGDGRRDIWNSPADALASAAHYLQASGWQQGQPWGFEVRLPETFDYALADMELRKTLGEWRRLGLRGLPADFDERSASLLLPAGHRGPAFLVLDNFRAILRYNNSSAYALAIGLLGERFQGSGQIAASWPRGEQPLSRSERLELQERLDRQGFNPGTPDGIIGANTRKAIRGFQQQLGWPADGHPSQELPGRLRDRP